MLLAQKRPILANTFRVNLPLVPPNQPSTGRLSAERVAEILDEDELAT
jgi:hypothetical protein